MLNGQGNDNGKTKKGLISKNNNNNTFARAAHLFCTFYVVVLNDYTVKRSRARSIGKSRFRFNLNPDFPIEREIQKRISPPRNPSSGWISIKKSKSGFHGFPFYRSIGKSENKFAKLFSWTAIFFFIIMSARARPLFLPTVFQILFRISQSNGKNENPKTDISALKSVFGFRVRLQIRNPDFKIQIQISQSNANRVTFYGGN